MELIQVNATKKELGLDKLQNPVKKGRELGNRDEMVNFMIQTFENGRNRDRMMYRANIFIFYNNGTFSLMYNDYAGIKAGKDLDKHMVTEFAKHIGNTEDCIVIYECEEEYFAVAA